MPFRGLVLGACLALTASAQDLITLDSSRAARGLGDVDGDGHADFAFEGHLFSGKTGAFVRFLAETDVRGVGDLNGDGADDVAFFEEGRAVVYSVQGWERIRTMDLPFLAPELTKSLADVPDVTGDGVPEVLVAVPDFELEGQTRRGVVWVCSGADGTIAHACTSTSKGDRLGRYASAGRRRADGSVQIVLASDERVSVVDLRQGGRHSWRSFDLPWFRAPVGAAGDVDGDDCVDFLYAKIEEEGLRVRVLSGADGSEVRTMLLPSAGPRVPSFASTRAAARVGDLDGDGRDDIALGDPGSNPDGVGRGSGSVRVFSGANGEPLFTMSGQEFSEGMWNCFDFGWTLAPAGDVDADGTLDFLVGADACKNVYYVFSGKRGRALYDVEFGLDGCGRECHRAPGPR